MVLPNRLSSVLIVLMVPLQACSELNAPPPRPDNVPIEAVRIGHNEMPFWVVCRVTEGENRCRVFNRGGEILEDDVFLPYDGGPPVAESDLTINPQCSQTQEICLQNGRILLQRAMFHRLKRRIDEQRAAADR